VGYFVFVCFWFVCLLVFFVVWLFVLGVCEGGWGGFFLVRFWWVCFVLVLVGFGGGFFVVWLGGGGGVGVFLFR